MARQKIGRNDPCPCGSGKKYKQCCESKANGLKLSGWAAIVAAIAAAAVLLLFVYNLTQDDVARAPTTCPPGQVWSPEHGHCH